MVADSIRERSVAGQEKARTEGRFPRPTAQSDRAATEVYPSRAVKGRKLAGTAKGLDVSRWTIQQVEGRGWTGNAASARIH